MGTSYPLEKIKVVLLENVHPGAGEKLRAEGYTVRSVDRALDEERLIDAAGDAHILGVRSKTCVTARYLQAAHSLWAIGCFCIGTEQVEADAAAARGVAVFNAPFANTRSVAELTIAEVVALARKLCDRSAALHDGEWRKSAQGAQEVLGKTLGIVGYGRIGSQVGLLAEALGMRVVFHDLAPCLPLGGAQPAASLDDLLAKADAVTLHVPGSPATRGLIGAQEIEQMKPGAFLVNNARGDVVDVGALASALRSGHLAGAAADVFPEEPASTEERFKSPLQGLGNVILTPHVGGSTAQAQERIGREVAVKLTRFMNNGATHTAVNVPQADLPLLQEDHHRILHFHRNVPGVLSKLHALIADLGVNVHAEHLQTDHNHGYVILDVDPTHGEALKEGLLRVPETIRVRTLW